MKKSLLTVLMVSVLTSAVALADSTTSATSMVTATIQPNIAINVDAQTDIGQWQSGLIYGTVTFAVKANREVAKFFVAATDLYKAGDVQKGVKICSRAILPTMAPQSTWLVALLGPHSRPGPLLIPPCPRRAGQLRGPCTRAAKRSSSTMQSKLRAIGTKTTRICPKALTLVG